MRISNVTAALRLMTALSVGSENNLFEMKVNGYPMPRGKSGAAAAKRAAKKRRNIAKRGGAA